jgi:predicted ABC-type ATPase
LFLWLDSYSTAKERVKHRVSLGGHTISEEVIERRYKRGIQNFKDIYINKVDYWIVFDNTKEPSLVAEGLNNLDFTVNNHDIWGKILNAR